MRGWLSAVLAAGALAAGVAGLWWAQSMMGAAALPDVSAPGGPVRDASEPPKAADPLAAEAAQTSARQRAISDLLADAQREELSDERLSEFEATLGSLRGTPAERDTWSKLKAFESAFPLFAASEEALFKCLKGRAADPRACEPTAEYRRLLSRGVADKALSRSEADRYLEILASMKDPRNSPPPLPPGGLEFLESESRIKVRNFRRIAEAVRRVEHGSAAAP